LAEYLHAHREAVEGKRVLELGSGCGGLSGIVAILLKASMTYLSDFPEVMPSLSENVRQNVPSDSPYKVIPLVWQDPQASGLKKGDVDIILAADCLYEKKIVEVFFQVIRYFECNAYLAGIVGEETYKEFLAVAPKYFDVILLSDREEGNRSAYFLKLKT
jgi:predicted nicotinamide N-methyase